MSGVDEGYPTGGLSGEEEGLGAFLTPLEIDRDNAIQRLYSGDDKRFYITPAEGVGSLPVYAVSGIDRPANPPGLTYPSDSFLATELYLRKDEHHPSGEAVTEMIALITEPGVGVLSVSTQLDNVAIHEIPVEALGALDDWV
jgi:hypothetical protein